MWKKILKAQYSWDAIFAYKNRTYVSGKSAKILGFPFIFFLNWVQRKNADPPEMYLRQTYAQLKFTFFNKPEETKNLPQVNRNNKN